MIIEHFLFTGVEEVNSYLVACPETGEAMIIDAGGFDDKLPVIVKEKKFKVRYLFITHSHYDHVEAVDRVIKTFPGIKVIAAAYGDERNSIRPADGIEFALGNLNGRIHHIPGHTSDMLVLYLNGNLFTGDALFAGSVGGTSSDLDYNRQIDGIRAKLLSYPDDTIIHPGHGPNSTIGLERSFDPFL
jgi:glyoxylase-like metal-dependent hydrolase (beta-lactamase superfamily II)